MNQKVRSVARYRGVMMRRSWEFRLFAVVSVLLIVFLQYLLQGGIGMGEHRVSLSASPPWLSTYFFNIAQSFMFVLVIGEVMARDKHPDYFLSAAGEIVVDDEDPFFDDNCYGDHIATAYVRLREKKRSTVSRLASNPEAGRCELWIYIPWIMPMTVSSAEEAMPCYVVRDKGGEREIGINMLKRGGCF